MVSPVKHIEEHKKKLFKIHSCVCVSHPRSVLHYFIVYLPLGIQLLFFCLVKISRQYIVKIIFLFVDLHIVKIGRNYIAKIIFLFVDLYINRPGIAGAFLLTALLLIEWVIHPLLKYFQYTIILKPEKVASWNFERRFTSPNLSCVMCHVSNVTCKVSHIRRKKSGGASWWRVCYQRGLTLLVSNEYNIFDRLSVPGTVLQKALSLIYNLTTSLTYPIPQNH